MLSSLSKPTHSLPIAVTLLRVMDSDIATASSANELVTAIRDSSFPESEEVLSSAIVGTNIPPLLSAIDAVRNDLSETVREVSRQEAGDVDGWIEQAKRVQADIARCKEDARNIVQEHVRIEALRSTQDQARSKSLMLQAEIAFNETLEKQILLISEASAAVSRINHDIDRQQLLLAAEALPSVRGIINRIPRSQPLDLLSRMHTELDIRLHQELSRELDYYVLVSEAHNELSISISPHGPGKHIPSEKDISLGEVKGASITKTLDSFELIGLKGHAMHQISQRIIEALLPHLDRRSKLKIAGSLQKDDRVLTTLSSDIPTAVTVISAVFQITKYVYDSCPSNIRRGVIWEAVSETLPLVVTEWLDPAIPTGLDDMATLNEIQDLVESFDTWLKERGCEQVKMLDAWMKEIPRIWLSKRRTLALDAVRLAFKRASGTTRTVERIERQTVNTQEGQAESADDDWTENWDDEDHQKDGMSDRKAEAKSDADDGSDAWGFDADEQTDEGSLPSNIVSGDAIPDDEAEAWGWGDDDGLNTKESPVKKLSSKEPNGLRQLRIEQKDIVLKEHYSITDIPEYIIEQIGIDLRDNHRLSESSSTYFKSVTTPLPDLGSLPTLTLAIFRAIATASYQSEFSPALSNMNLYNDVLYLTSKLGEGLDDASTVSSPLLTSQIPMLEKFARQVYTSEISTHRTILLDLLDTAQGFVSCTRSPYAETCETAITSTTEYLRSMYTQWSPILSPSHLYQSIGNLLNSMMRKIIEDIEDMEDISEPESRKLLSLCEPVSALQDLFMVSKPRDPVAGQATQEDGPMSTIAVHCASYLRFQYLQQILESNLVEIKYLWTDAGLSLEFRADEVVDLIQALFTESSQRRSAINTIRAGS